MTGPRGIAAALWGRRQESERELARRLGAAESENRELKRAVSELSTLNELAREIGSHLETAEIMDILVHRSLKAVDAEQAAIALVDHDEPADAHTLIRVVEGTQGGERFHLDQALLGRMLLHERPFFSNSPHTDPRLGGVLLSSSVRSLLCVPMMARSKLIGVLAVYNRRGGTEFDEADQRLLAIIAAQSAQVVENARLLEEERAYDRMREQLRMARRIQLALLPSEPPTIPGYEVAGTSRPAQTVGGDYFDYIELSDARWGLALGDVSGKGLPASLLMANLQATLRAQALADGPIADGMARANRMLHSSTDPEKFATLLYGVLDSGSHKLEFCSAGHEPALLYRCHGRGRLAPEQLGASGPPVGALPDSSYQAGTADFARGDCLITYSDGVTDATDADGVPFGAERLHALLADACVTPASELVERVMRALDRHAGETAQADDITLFVLRRLPSPGEGENR